MINFTLWDNLLREYVDDQGRVDYARWQQESLVELDQWLSVMSQVDWHSLDQSTAIAFLINLYNALTIQQVLHNYPIASIRPKLLGIPNWFAFLQFFTKKIYRLNGQSLSLNTIEHQWLRPTFEEPRIHFALVCASIGCPQLRAAAYTPDQLTQQLHVDVSRFIHHPDKVRYDDTRQILYCSKIFKWYEADFLTVTDSIADYIDRHHTQLELPQSVKIVYLPYSWDLNQRTSS